MGRVFLKPFIPIKPDGRLIQVFVQLQKFPVFFPVSGEGFARDWPLRHFTSTPSLNYWRPIFG